MQIRKKIIISSRNSKSFMSFFLTLIIFCLATPNSFGQQIQTEQVLGSVRATIKQARE
jgi:hypothetical protein